MTNEEKLLLAIGEIDDGLIAEASSAYPKRFTPMMRGVSVAASVVAVSAVVLATSGLFAQKSFDKNASSGEAAPPNDIPAANGSEGSDGSEGGSFVGTLESEYGYIYNIVRIDKHKILFDLKILSECEDEFDVVILGRNSEGESAICTNGEAGEKYSLVLTPIITVNGERTDSLPTTPGGYTVLIDYSAIADTDFIWNDYIKILHFGTIEK